MPLKIVTFGFKYTTKTIVNIGKLRQTVKEMLESQSSNSKASVARHHN